MLLCDTAQSNSTVPVSCLRSIMKMSHVTLANARRVRNGDSQVKKIQWLTDGKRYCRHKSDENKIYFKRKKMINLFHSQLNFS